MNDSIDIKINVDLSGLTSGLQAAQQQVNNAANAMRTAFAGINQSSQQAVSGTNNFSNASTQMGSRSTATTAILNQLNGSINNLVNALNRSSTAFSSTSTVINNFGNSTRTSNNNINTLNQTINQTGQPTNSLTGSINSLAAAFAGLSIARKASEFINESKKSIIEAEMAYRGLEQVAGATGIGMDKANQLAMKYAKTTALSLTEAQSAIKSILQMGGSIDQADKMLAGATDLAVNGRQKGKKYGQSIVEGFEGLRMGISTNTNNMGWQENIDAANEKYAQSIGKVKDALTDEEKVQAALVSIMKEAAYAKDAASTMNDTLGGKQEQLNKQLENTHQVVGQALTPAFEFLNGILSNFYQSISNATKGLQLMGAGAGYAFDIIAAMGKGIANFSTEKMVKETEIANRAFREYRENLGKTDGANFSPSGKQTPTVDKTKEETPEQKYKKAEELYKQELQLAKNKDELTRISLQNDLKMLDANLKAKLINHKEYAKKYEEIQNDMAKSTDTFLNSQLTGLQKLLSLGYEPKKAAVQLDVTKTQGEIDANKKRAEGIHATAFGKGISGPTAIDIKKAEYEAERSNLEGQLSLFKAHNQGVMDLSAFRFQNFKMSAKDYYAELARLQNAEIDKEKEITEKEIAELKKRKPKDAVDGIKIKEDLEKATNRLKLAEEDRSRKMAGFIQQEKQYNDVLEKQRFLKSIEGKKEQADANLDVGQLNNQKKLVLHQLSNAQMIELDKQYEEAKYQNTKSYLESQRTWLLQNEEQNQQAILELDRQLESARIQSETRIAQIKHQLWLEQNQDYIVFTDTMRGSLSKLFSDIAKHPRDFKQAMTNALQSIADKLLEIASRKLMEQAFGMPGSSSGGGSSLISQGINYVAGALGFNVPKFDVGTNYVPNDMIAQIHEGERIVPAKFNTPEYNYGAGKTTSSNVSVNNNFILQQQPDRRTQQQMAAMAAASISNAARRNN